MNSLQKYRPLPFYSTLLGRGIFYNLIKKIINAVRISNKLSERRRLIYRAAFFIWHRDCLNKMRN